jgi:uncharacterized membrane protein
VYRYFGFVPVAAAVADWALFFHLLGALALIAGVVVAGVGYEAARRRRSAAEVALLLGLTRAGVLLVAVGSLLVLPFGLWLVHIEHVGYGASWVDAALGLFAAMGALGGFGGQRPRRARELAAQLAETHHGESAELRALLDDRVARSANYLSAALLVAIVVLMVFKPGGPSG